MKVISKNNLFIILILILLCLITIGYASYNEIITLNGNVSVKEAGKLEIVDASIIKNECSNLNSYDDPTYDGLNIQLNIISNNTNFTATYLITVANNSLWDYTYAGFPVNAILEGYDYVPVVTSTVTNNLTGEILETGNILKSGEQITIKLKLDFSLDRTQGNVTVVVNGNYFATLDNSGNLLASVTPTTGNLKGENTLAEFQLNVINSFKYKRSFHISSSNENIEIVDETGNIINDLSINESTEQSYKIYLRIKEGSVFLSDKTQTNIIISSSYIDNINAGTIELDVDIDLTATDHEKPIVGNVNLMISPNNPVNGEAILTWNRIDSGGSPISNYIIILHNVDTGEIKQYETGNDITNITIKDLQEGNYYAQVYGIDEAGNSGKENCLDATTSSNYCSNSNNTFLKWLFNITTSLSNLSFEGETTALIYSNYQGKLSINSGGAYSLPESINVTMGGTTLISAQDYSYDAGSGTIIINKVTGDILIEAEARNSTCLVEGTKIRLANGTYKNIENINYNDLLMVYDHENGGITFEYPIWIESSNKANYYQKTTFSDGSVLETVGAHNVFDAQKMQYININNPNEFKVGTSIIKIDELGNIKTVKATKIEYIYEEVNYYHVASTRYYNIIANDFITSDGLEVSSFLYNFNEDLTWGNKREELLKSNDLFDYEDWKMIFPEYLFRGLRMEEAKIIYNHGLLDVNHIVELLNYRNTLLPIKDDYGTNLWMVTTSDDIINEYNKNDYLYKEGSYYVLKEPNNNYNFIGWLNTSDNRLYQPNDKIKVIYGIHLIAKYKN